MQARCYICKKKLGLLPFRCKCEKDFCALHRAPEDHECTFDFKSDARIVLEKNNPVCESNKLHDKI